VPDPILQSLLIVPVRKNATAEDSEEDAEKYGRI
jgi:hypothetical protein